MNERAPMDAVSDPNWSRRIGVGVGLVVLLTLIGLLGADDGHDTAPDRPRASHRLQAFDDA